MRMVASHGPALLPVHWWPYDPAAQPVATWELTTQADPGGVPVSSGTAEIDTTGDATRGNIPFQVPQGLEQGAQLFLHATLAVDTVHFGRLSGTTVSRVEYDGMAELTMTVGAPTVYPVRDYYYDSVGVSVSSPEGVTDVRIELLDENGVVLKRILSTGVTYYRRRWETEFGARYGRELLAEGSYLLRARAVDASGNVAEARGEIAVSHQRRERRKWSRTIPAAATVVDKRVGNCSRLVTPSSHGWKGSLGYYSLARCGRLAGGEVSTLNGAFVPRSLGGRYWRMRITVNGGAARTARSAYLVMYYRNKHGRFVMRRQFNGTLGAHPGAFVLDPAVRGRRSESPAVYWFVGLSEGSQYDIRSFKVEIEYSRLTR